MSRSRKKHPVATDKTNKWAKKDANKRIRKEDIGNGGNYKKTLPILEHLRLQILGKFKR